MSNFHRSRRVFFAALLALPLFAQAADAPPKPVSVEITTNLGAITVALDPAKAPKTVANFLHYVKSGFYDGTIFHRVIPGFMIQGGGFTTGFVQKPTQAPIVNEAGNGLSNLRGTIAMARTSQPDSATSQFFINVADNKFLDRSAPTPQGAGYAVFGHVTKGMSVVDAIVNTPTGAGGPFPQDVPQKAVIIESIKVLP
ncbi:peptidylprolyl isomerase [Halothiobacillus sp. DCM-1]|uniref:peptidylprolyl isomerase n=1 Tax=Halothiobacillus sp. DCM-1 TaxID=3112558 RepID=UPI0032477B6D